MNALPQGSNIALLSADGSVILTACDGTRHVTEPEASHSAVCYDEYLMMLEHHVLSPFQMHKQSFDRRILLPDVLKTDLWHKIFLRYGKTLFKFLSGPYQVYQELPGTKSYIQVSGRGLSAQLTQPGALTPRTQSGPIVPRQAKQRSADGALSSVMNSLGSNLYMFKSKPQISPDRLFARMSYTRWHNAVFGVLPRGLSSLGLRDFHRKLCQLKVGALFELFTTKERTEVSETDLFENAIPLWKIRQVIKKLLTELGLQQLFGCQSTAITRRLQKLFTCNRFTKLKPQYLTAGIKIRELMWLKEFSSPGEDRNEFLKKFLGWIVQFIAYCFRYFLYVTESREHRKRPLYYIRQYWEDMAFETIHSYTKTGVFTRLGPYNHANYRLRFLAGRSKLRPILTFDKSSCRSSRRYKLLDLLACLKHIQLNTAGYAAQCHDPLMALRQFSGKWRLDTHKNRKKLYFVKSDISKCYDSINRDLLLTILKNVMATGGTEELSVWKIVVILAGSKPCRTYIDHVSTDSNGNHFESLSKACTAHLKTKGIASAIFVPLYQAKLTVDQVMNSVKDHLQNVNICVTHANQQYKLKMTQGIPQGSIISPVLCDIYYGAMERQLLHPNLESSCSLLLRNVDDYMLLTSQPEVAADFVSVLMSEEVRQRYNCVIQPQKSVTNIPDHPSDIHSSDDDRVQWCQYVICLKTGSVTLPYYSTQDVENSVSFNAWLKPVEHIRSLLLKHICVFTNPIYIDSVINSERVIRANISEIFRLCAIKFCYLIAYLPNIDGVSKNTELWLDMIISTGCKLYKIIVNHSRRRSDQIAIQKSVVLRCCLTQFVQFTGSWRNLALLRMRMTESLERLYVIKDGNQ